MRLERLTKQGGLKSWIIDSYLRNSSIVRYDSHIMQPFDSNFGKFEKPERTGQTVTVGRTDDVPQGRGATIELPDGRELALYNIEDKFYAIENFCPHKGAPLAEGNLCGHTIQCDWHGWQFDVRTGQCLTTTSGDIEIFEVLIEGELLKVVV